MATVINNDLTRGLRGRVGKWIVFRTRGGKTFASHAPRKPDPTKQSAAQRQTRSAFREAAAWAVRTLKDPEQRECYLSIAKAESLPNAYTAALRAHMRGDVAKRMSGGENHPVSTREAVQACEPAKTSIYFHSGGRRRESERTQNQLNSHRDSFDLKVLSPGGRKIFRERPRKCPLNSVILTIQDDAISFATSNQCISTLTCLPRKDLMNEDGELVAKEVIERRQPRSTVTYDYNHGGNKPYVSLPAELPL